LTIVLERVAFWETARAKIIVCLLSKWCILEIFNKNNNWQYYFKRTFLLSFCPKNLIRYLPELKLLWLLKTLTKKSILDFKDPNRDMETERHKETFQFFFQNIKKSNIAFYLSLPIKKFQFSFRFENNGLD
jgi:hypothetical protein